MQIPEQGSAVAEPRVPGVLVMVESRSIYGTHQASVGGGRPRTTGGAGGVLGSPQGSVGRRLSLEVMPCARTHPTAWIRLHCNTPDRLARRAKCACLEPGGEKNDTYGWPFCCWTAWIFFFSLYAYVLGLRAW